MGTKPFRPLHAAWCLAVVLLIGLLQLGPSSEQRLTLLTILSLLSFPSSYVAAPVGHWLVWTLDVSSTRSIDSILAVSIAVAGYIQWFWLLPRLRRLFSRRTPAPDSK